MKVARILAVFAVPVLLATVPIKSGAQILGDSVAFVVERVPIASAAVPEGVEFFRYTLTVPITVDLVNVEDGTISDRLTIDKGLSGTFLSDPVGGGGAVGRLELCEPFSVQISSFDGQGGNSDRVDFLSNQQLIARAILAEIPGTVEGGFGFFLVQGAVLSCSMFEPDGTISDTITVDHLTGSFLSDDDPGGLGPPDPNSLNVRIDESRVNRAFAVVGRSDVPEPGTLALFFSGLTVFGGCAWRKRRSLR